MIMNFTIMQVFEKMSTLSSLEACGMVQDFNKDHTPLFTSNMCEEDKKALHGRILTDFERITSRFSSLNKHIIKSLNLRSITPQEIAILLSELPATMPDGSDSRDRKSLLEPCLDSITSAKDVEGGFKKFNPFQSFFDCHLTKHVVMSDMCNDDDKKQFEEYSTELETYCKRRVYECPQRAQFLDSKLEHDEQKMFEIIEATVDVKDYTLAQLNELCNKVARTLNLERHTLCLHSIRDSRHLLFQIPFFIMEETIPFFKRRSEEFKSLLIHEIKYKSDTLFINTSKSLVTALADSFYKSIRLSLFTLFFL